MPKVSILIPIYNVESYLSKCLDSVLAQTLNDLEIICINDGSTDNSLEIIKEYVKKDKRIIVLNKKNTGYGDSMNLGLRKATGEYIGIVEPDDWIEPEAFAELYGLAESNKTDVVKANYYKFRGNDPEFVVKEISDYGTKVIKKSDHVFDYFKFAPAIWSAIYRRAFLLENDIRFLPTPGASYQDLGFSFKCWVVAKQLAFTSKPYYHYRLDNAGSSVNTAGKMHCVVDEYKSIEQFLRDRDLYDSYSAIMQAAKFRNYHWNFQRLIQLNPTLARDFYNLWRDELLAANSTGELSPEYFGKKDLLALVTILYFPKFAFARLSARVRRKKAKNA